MAVLERELDLVAVQLAQPDIGVEPGDVLDQFLHHQPGVALDEVVGLDHLAAFAGVDVDVNHRRVAAEPVRLADDAVVEAGADRHHQVALHHRLVGVGGAVHAEHAQRQRVGLRERALAQQRGGDRRLQALGQAPYRVGCLGDQCAVAGQDHRPLGGVERRRRLHDHVAVALFGDPVAGYVHLLERAVAHRRLAHVLGHVDQYRTGPPVVAMWYASRTMRGMESVSLTR